MLLGGILEFILGSCTFICEVLLGSANVSYCRQHIFQRGVLLIRCLLVLICRNLHTCLQRRYSCKSKCQPEFMIQY